MIFGLAGGLHEKNRRWRPAAELMVVAGSEQPQTPVRRAGKVIPESDVAGKLQTV
jgi:hypothetical protein